MADEKRIKVGIDSSGYQSEFDKIKQSAESLANDLIRSSRAYSTSSKEVLSDIQDQIRAIERRNELEAAGRRQVIEEARSRQKLTPDERKSALAGVASDVREDSLQIKYLREIIEAVKQTSKEEIRENRSGVERRLQGSGADILGPSGDPKGVLRDTIQQGELSRIAKEEGDQRRGGGGRGAAGIAGAMMSANDPYSGAVQAGGAGIGMIGGAAGVIGAIVALGAGKAISEAMPYMQALGRNVAITGGSQGDYAGFGEKYSAYGFKLSETLGRRSEMATARLGGAGAGDAALDSLLLEGFGVGGDISIGLERQTRGGASGAMIASDTMARALRGTGMIKGEDFSALPEYLQLLVQLQQQQLLVTGEIDTGINVKMIAGISNLDKSFKNPEVLSMVIDKIKGGLTGATSPQAEALQYSVLSRLFPEKDMFQLMEARQDPKVRMDYLSGMLGTLRSISPTDSGFMMNIVSQFGLKSQPGFARRIAEGYKGGGLEKTLSSEEMNQLVGLGDVEARNLEATSILQKRTTEFSNAFAKSGDKIIKTMDEAAIEAGVLATGFKETLIALDDFRQGLSNTIWGNLFDMVDWMKTKTDDLTPGGRIPNRINQ